MELYSKSMFEKLIKNPKYLLLAFIFTSLIVYFPTIGAGMVFDFNSWILKYLSSSFSDVLNSFGYPGLHQMEQFAFFTLFKFFKLNTFAWYFVFAILHSLTAYIAFLFLFKWLSTLKTNQPYVIALVTSSLFLISPIAADVVVNKVTIHYLMSNMFIYGALFYLIKYYETSNVKNIILTFLLFGLALFSLEISYVFPVIYFTIWISLFYFNDELLGSKKFIIPIFLPFVILILFLLLHKILIGSFIGHYGPEVHTKFDLGEIYSTVVRYFASYSVLFDYWPYKYKAKISVFLSNNSNVLIAITIFVFGLIGGYSLNRKNKRILLITISFILALISLAPIANLYYAYMFPIENDRYSYLSSIFIYLSIVLLVYQIKFVKFRWLVLSVFFVFNIFFLFKNVQTFSTSSKLTWGLLNDFRWFDKEVIILEDPDIFSGAKIFGTKGNTTSFSESLLLHTGIDRRNNIRSIYQMNFTSLNDSINVKKISPTQYRVEMAQWGTWFMKDLIGASSYENAWCKTELHKEGLNYYNLFLKENNENVVLIYAAGNKWTEVK